MSNARVVVIVPKGETALQRDAKWIWVNAEMPEVNTYGLFRRRFRLDDVPPHIRGLIACDSRYQLFVNGKYVGRGVAPNHPEQPFYDIWDLAPLLKDGENCIAVVVHFRGIDTFNYIAGYPGLWLQLMDGDSMILGTDSSWKAALADAWRFGPLPRISAQQGFIEIYDARKEPVGWMNLEFNDGDWRHAREVEGPETLHERPVPNTVESELLPTKVVQRGWLRSDPAISDNPAAAIMSDELRPAPFDHLHAAQSLCQVEPAPVFVEPDGDSDGSYFIFDLNRESTGTIRFTIEAPAGISVDIAHGEHLDDGRVRALTGGRHFADRYITRDGLQSYDISFKRVGCRYIELHIRHGELPVTLHRVSLLEDVYPFQQRGQFRCSDTLLNDIWDVCAHTLRCCVHETYEDCPWREQSQYAGDSRLQALAGYRVFGETAMPRKALVQLATPMPNGFHGLTYPGRFERFIPGYDLIWISMIWEYYQYTGDAELIRELYPEVKRLLKEFDEYTRRDGLLKDLGKLVPGAWQFTDWAGLSEEGIVAAQNLFYLEALRNASAMAAVLGDKDLVAEFAKQATVLSGTLVESFRISGQPFRLADNLLEEGPGDRISQHVHSLALLLDLVPYGRRHEVADAMLKGSDMTRATLYFKYYLFAALLQLDRDYLTPVLDIIREHWGGMIRQGATSFWEREDGGDAFGYAGSLCHAWSAHPAYFFSTEVLGVKSMKPGGSELLIYPNPGSLFWARGIVPFPAGDVAVAWERGPRALHLEAIIPDGCRAKLLVPIPLENCEAIELDSGDTWHPEERMSKPFISEMGVVGVLAGPGRTRIRGLAASWKWPGQRKAVSRGTSYEP